MPQSTVRLHDSSRPTAEQHTWFVTTKVPNLMTSLVSGILPRVQTSGRRKHLQRQTGLKLGIRPAARVRIPKRKAELSFPRRLLCTPYSSAAVALALL